METKNRGINMIGTEFSAETAEAESAEDRQASQQIVLDILCHICQKYAMASEDIGLICDIANVRLNALMAHCGTPTN